MRNQRPLFLFFAATVCLAAANSVNDSVFNNFLKDTYVSVSATARGGLEFPRETPGFLVVLLAGALAAIPVARVGVVAAGTLAAGFVGLVLLGSHWSPMVAMLVLASTGLHLMMPVESSIAIGLGDASKRGQRMGQVDAMRSLGSVVATAGVWLLFRRYGTHYRAAFAVAAALAAAGAGFYYLMHIPHLHAKRPRLVYRAKYNLYYTLELLYGARKQIFITFGYWVLVQIYGEEPHNIAALLLIAGVLGLGFKPLVGRLIDRLGERTMLVADGMVMIFVCLGYGYAADLMPTTASARLLACACFVFDSMLFTVGSARAIYVSRIIHSPEELTSTLSMGISMNHVVSMIIPFFGGALWDWLGYRCVFLVAAALALAVGLNALRVPRRDVLRRMGAAAAA